MTCTNKMISFYQPNLVNEQNKKKESRTENNVSKQKHHPTTLDHLTYIPSTQFYTVKPYRFQLTRNLCSPYQEKSVNQQWNQFKKTVDMFHISNCACHVWSLWARGFCNHRNPWTVNKRLLKMSPCAM